MSINALLEKRGGIVNAMTSMLDKAAAEGRDLTSEESAVYDAMDKDQSSIKAQVDRMAKHAELTKELETVVTDRVKPAVSADASEKKFGKTYGVNFYNALRTGIAAARPEVLNALQVGTASEGGYITPESFETALVMAMQDISEIRQYANVITTDSTRNIPVETGIGSAQWQAEEAAYTESDASFGQVILGAHKLGTIIKVSEELLQDSFFDLEGYLAGNFGKRFGLAEEAAFVNGDGSGKPSGIVGGSTLGTTAASNAAITSDELIDLFHNLKRPYRGGAAWMMNDSTAKLIRKLKDGNGDYLWQAGLQAGMPDTILGRPVIVSAAMPTVGSATTPIVFGDLSYYTIADRRGTVMQRLNELYAANGQVGFRAYKRTEGKVILSEAIQNLTMAV